MNILCWALLCHIIFNLFTQEVYDKEFVDRVYKLPSVTLSEVLYHTVSHTEVKLQYTSKKDFEATAKRLKIMPDFRVTVIQMPPSTRQYELHLQQLSLMQGGVPRTAYKGIVSFRYRSKRIHLIPPDHWTGYENMH